MQKILALASLVLLILGASFLLNRQSKQPLLQSTEIVSFKQYLNDIANEVNSMNGMWKATTYPRWADVDYVTIKGMMGALTPPDFLEEYYTEEKTFPENELQDIPATFNAATQWPQCTSIGEIRDQANCGSCWAVGGATAMTDRWCIAKNDTNYRVSYQNLLSCCSICGFGCNGGFPIAGWLWWSLTGLTSGDQYEDYQYCQPYTIKPCGLHCPSTIEPTPQCLKDCDPKYTGKTPYAQTFSHGTSYNIKGVQAIQKEIQTNGPVEAAFTVYADFMTYKSGVYKHVSGQQLGGHAVKIYGWGTENGEDYWLIANSWSSEWGETGSFRILRGTNECGIEAGVVGGLPK